MKYKTISYITPLTISIETNKIQIVKLLLSNEQIDPNEILIWKKLFFIQFEIKNLIQFFFYFRIYNIYDLLFFVIQIISLNEISLINSNEI